MNKRWISILGLITSLAFANTCEDLKKIIRTDNYKKMLSIEYNDGNYTEVIGIFRCFLKNQRLSLKDYLIIADSFFKLGYYEDAARIYSSIFLKKINTPSLKENIYKKAIDNYVTYLINIKDYKNLEKLLSLYQITTLKSILSKQTKIMLAIYFLKKKNRHLAYEILDSNLRKKFYRKNFFILSSLGYENNNKDNIDSSYLKTSLLFSQDRILKAYYLTVYTKLYLDSKYSSNNLIVLYPKIKFYKKSFNINLGSYFVFTSNKFYSTRLLLSEEFKNKLILSQYVNINYDNNTRSSLGVTFTGNMNLIYISLGGEYLKADFISYFSKAAINVNFKKEDIGINIIPSIEYKKTIDDKTLNGKITTSFYYVKKRKKFFIKSSYLETYDLDKKKYFPTFNIEGGFNYVY